jgi:signal transduction histidine kinase
MPARTDSLTMEKLSPKRKLIFIWTVAIMLPVIVLIVFQYLSLSNIRRTHAIDAVIQRDFMQTLRVVERKSTDQLKVYGHSLAGEMRAIDFNGLSTSEVNVRLNAVLEHFSFADTVFYYDERRGLFITDRHSLRTQAESDALAVKKRQLGELVKLEHFPANVAMLRESELKGDFRIVPLAIRRNDEDEVRIVVYFAVPPYQGSPFQIAGYMLNSTYLAKEFFPKIFRSMEAESMSGEHHDLRSTIIAIHYVSQPQNIIASSQPVDSDEFEMGRTMGYGPWRYFVSAIKPKGATIEGISTRYLRWNFLMVTFMVLVLVAGMILTLRNVSREMELAQLKSDFVSNVSHELKTPLALIRLFAETLEMQRVRSQERQKEYFSTIRKESERLTQLIDNILDFSRIEAGKREYEFARVNVSDLVRQVIESYRFHVEQEGFVLKVKIDDSVPPLWVDRDALSQAILNLLNNALKYSLKEKVIAVTLAHDEHDVQISVEDRGIGIARGDQKKIFEKFYRASNSLVHDNKGSGLGLSLVQHIVKAHRGSIQVESRMGEGSRFTIHLPLTKGPAEKPTTPVSSEESVSMGRKSEVA